MKKSSKSVEKGGQKYLHMRVTELEKENQILMYELALHRKLLKSLHIDEENEMFLEIEKIVNSEVKANVLEKLKKSNVGLEASL